MPCYVIHGYLFGKPYSHLCFISVECSLSAIGMRRFRVENFPISVCFLRGIERPPQFKVSPFTKQTSDPELVVVKNVYLLEKYFMQNGLDFRYVRFGTDPVDFKTETPTHFFEKLRVLSFFNVAG